MEQRAAVPRTFEGDDPRLRAHGAEVPQALAEWTGIPLVEVLDRAGIKPEAREVLFRGADAGMVHGRMETIRFDGASSLTTRGLPRRCWHTR